MEKEQRKRADKRQIPQDEFFNRIMALHGSPCYVLLEVNGNKITLIGAASNFDSLQLAMSTKHQEKISYFG